MSQISYKIYFGIREYLYYLLMTNKPLQVIRLLFKEDQR